MITHPGISPSTDELSAYGHTVGLFFFFFKKKDFKIEHRVLF